MMNKFEYNFITLIFSKMNENNCIIIYQELRYSNEL